MVHSRARVVNIVAFIRQLALVVVLTKFIIQITSISTQMVNKGNAQGTHQSGSGRVGRAILLWGVVCVKNALIQHVSMPCQLTTCVCQLACTIYHSTKCINQHQCNVPACRISMQTCNMLACNMSACSMSMQTCSMSMQCANMQYNVNANMQYAGMQYVSMQYICSALSRNLRFL